MGASPAASTPQGGAPATGRQAVFAAGSCRNGRRRLPHAHAAVAEIRIISDIPGTVLGTEAPAWKGARSAHTGSMQSTSNAAEAG